MKRSLHRPGRRVPAVVLTVALAAVTLGSIHPVTAGAAAAVQRPMLQTVTGSPPESSFFSTASVQESATSQTASAGDLWPSCWSGDGNLYAANGDGEGFTTSSPASDVTVSQVTGNVGNLTGTTLAQGNAIGQVWTSGNYNRKPTGMLCVNGTLYMAVQDLNTTFNDAPAATIAKSIDHGHTWTWDHSAPMFSGHTFTTIFFADFGQDNANSPDGYVYAYGLDNNWRTSYDGSVHNPTNLYLARVPATSIQNRSSWQFYTGTTNGTPTFSADISQRQPVLHDDRVIYQNLINPAQHNLTVLSQGGVTYDKPLNRYLYTSWSEYTFEFYESPTPYGPWKHFLTKDFGGYPWTQTKNGGYGTSIPSKFISADGTSMYVQSNVCSCGGGGTSVYDFTLRNLVLAPAVSTTASNNPSDTVNLAQSPGTVPIERVAHFGHNLYYNDGITTNSEDDWNNEIKPLSWWGYTWPRQYTVNKVVYTTGIMPTDGGWYASNLHVQVRNGNTWQDVTTTITPAYPYNNTAGANTTYTLTFNTTATDGVRIIGTPGGSSTFTSIGELAAYNSPAGAPANLVADPSFENQTSNSISTPWATEGPDGHGIDRALGDAHTGSNNAWIRTSTTNWNSITQHVALMPNTNYLLTGWIRGSANVSGYFGVRPGTGTTPLTETTYQAASGYTQLSLPFASGSNTSVTLYAGYHGPGSDSYVQLDDVSIQQTP